MTTELPKVYDPKQVEKSVYERWLDAGAFNAEAGGKAATYCIVIPPPNITAALHLGQAMNSTLQDILIRFKRMEQFKTLWMPGTDHASIATQTIVEKRILAEEGKRRSDFQREEFVARVQAWKDQYEARIIHQLKLIGCSCDWRRTRFTMDEICTKAVRETFFRLFADGLIYRGKYLVNWDPATQTVLADDEVEHETVQGHFWYLRYPLVEPVEAGGQIMEHVTVATTRPETMLGDTAVAMNPRDPRAKALVGRKVRLPLVGRIIPIITDDHVVLPDDQSQDEKARYSTGFLKVTPAHDPDDYAIGERHLDEIHDALVDCNPNIQPGAWEAAKRQIVFVNVMAPDGSISEGHGWYDARGSEAEFVLGMDRFEAREAVVEWFRKEQLLEKVVEYVHEVGHSYRSHAPIEPYLSDQWYVAVKKRIPGVSPGQASTGETDTGETPVIPGTDVPVNSLAGLALGPLLDGRVRFIPERYANTYRSWLENLRDWPISRQLWWGHQIPVWSQDLELPADVKAEATDRGPDAQTCAALDRAAGGHFGQQLAAFPGIRHFLTTQKHPERDDWIRTYICLDRDDEVAIAWLEEAGWKQDPDVLDTWFSSALWPFSTMGWPDETPELEAFYPGNALVTAREIITLWVSRMVMMGQYCVGDIPFTDVFIHAMIQDGQGRKMSKSLGNGVDPLDIIDSHGADGMRFTLAGMTTQTQDVRIPVEKVKLPDGRTVNSSPRFDIGRNFCNKLWNASRFTLMNIDGLPAWSQIRPRAHAADTWILSRLNATVRDVTGAMDAYRFNEVADTLYHFMWDDFCDWYLEIAKFRINAGEATPKAVLAHCLDILLRLLHPLTPFITEAIWQELNAIAPHRCPGDTAPEEMLVCAMWPRADGAMINEAAEQGFASLQEIVRQIRNVRTEHNVPPSDKVNLAVEAEDDGGRIVRDNADLLKFLARVGEISFGTEAGTGPAGAAAVLVGPVKIYVLDIVDAKAEVARLTKQGDRLTKGITAIEAKLASDGFLAKAPAELVDSERERLAKLRGELARVEESLRAVE